MSTVRVSPRVISIFLVKFDVRKGNVIVWSKSKPGEGDAVKSGCEFRALPSGLHNVTDDVIYFVQPTTDRADQFYEGLSVFHQRYDNLGVRQHSDDNNDDQQQQDHGQFNSLVGRDRSKLEIYSLAVLCASNEEEDSKIWMYSDALKALLTKFMDGGREIHKYAQFERFFDRYSVATEIRPGLEMPLTHPISAVRSMLTGYGPLIFEIWKAVMARTRLILLNPAVSVEEMCQFVYVLSIIGSVPSDITHLFSPRVMQKHGAVNALYSVSLPDAQWLGALNNFSAQSYVATTRDSILLDKQDNYDVSVVTQVADSHTKLTVNNCGSGVYYATARDKRRFQILIDALNIHAKIAANSSYADHLGDWLGGAVDNVSALCSQTTINGFLWWASAGEAHSDECLQDAEGLLPPSATMRSSPSHHPSSETSSSMEPLINHNHPPRPLLADELDIRNSDNEVEAEPPMEIMMIGYFQQMSRRMFQTISTVIQAQEYDNDGESVDAITIDATDIRRMGLDPYARSDYDFAKRIVRVWFDRDVKLNHAVCLNVCC